MEETPAQKKPTIIRTPDQRLRVFISSTLKELAEEREAVRSAVLKLRLVPVMFEAGARPHPADDLYRAYLSQSHIFIGIYWQSYGWVGPGMDISGLEDEYNLSANMPRLIYIKSPAPQREAGLEQMLKRLQDENTASYKRFTTTEELGDLVENDLALLLTESYEVASRLPSAEFTPAPLTNIPFPRNPLLGRQAELNTLCDWLSLPETGLVTLVGAGGVGKSRLALEAALRLRRNFPDGVYLVRLTSVTDPARVLPTIAETLGLRETAQGLPVDQVLARSLRDRHSLLVLDNFEQILPAAAQVSGLLEGCPNLKLLVTSRAPLHVRAEKELPVLPLPVPALQEAIDPGRLSQFASVELFIQRAQAIRPDFRVTDENAPAVAEICYRLDGLPLAIELAAARIKLLRPQELLARLERRFDVLRGGTRDLPERQQTLRAAIDWSYNLLSEPARALFRRLSVFAGNWSLEAAEQVCNLDDDLGSSLLEELELLVDSSLLFPMDGLEGRQRFAMMETIREYAAERLEQSGEAARLRLLHAEHFLSFARELEPRIRTAERVRWRAIFEQDFDNVRAALRWGLSDPAGLATGQQIIVVLAHYWAIGGPIREGRQWTNQYLARVGDDTPARIRAGLLCISGMLQLVQGDTRSAVASLQESLPYARQSEEDQILVTCLLSCGLAVLVSGAFDPAADVLRECVDLSREIADQWSEALASFWLSYAELGRGEAARSAELFEQAFALARRQGDPWCLVAPLADLAQEAFAAGDLEKAERALLEAESACRTVGDRWTLPWILNSLGQIDLARARAGAARDRIHEALRLSREYGNRVGAVMSLVDTAALLTLRDSDGPEAESRRLNLRTAARLCGAVQFFDSDPALLGGGIRAKIVYDLMLARVHSSIEAEIWDPAFAEGTSLSLDRALDMAALELAKPRPEG